MPCKINCSWSEVICMLLASRSKAGTSKVPSSSLRYRSVNPPSSQTSSLICVRGLLMKTKTSPSKTVLPSSPDMMPQRESTFSHVRFLAVEMILTVVPVSKSIHHPISYLRKEADTGWYIFIPLTSAKRVVVWVTGDGFNLIVVKPDLSLGGLMPYLFLQL